MGIDPNTRGPETVDVGPPIKSIPNEVAGALSSAVARGQRTVVMTCGISGSGKSTLAKSITEAFPSFIRFSIDQYMFEHHGIYGRDFPPELYEPYQDEAEAALKGQLRQILTTGSNDIVLDYSFWCRKTRDEYRAIVDAEGAGLYQVILVSFRASEETLWERIEKREAERVRRETEGSAPDRDPGYKVSRDVLRSYVNGFEFPQDEGEIIVMVE